MKKTALILGSSGRFCGAMTEALWNAGWSVRIFDRAKDDLAQSAMGVDVIVNAWNPPYHHWARDLPEQTSRVIDAARASGARVLFPGNVYVYGADAGPIFGPNTPHEATNTLGRIRREVEATYKASGIDLLILRAGDYIDTGNSGNWFDKIITKPLAKGRIDYPGDLDVPHAWAYLPDLAQAAVMLLDGDLEPQTEVVFPGYTLSGRHLAHGLSLAANRPVTARPMAWWPIKLASLVMPLLRGVLEMRYLWDKPHEIDRDAFEAALPGFVDTPLHEALGETEVVKALEDARPPKPTRGAIPRPPHSPARAT